MESELDMALIKHLHDYGHLHGRASVNDPNTYHVTKPDAIYMSPGTLHEHISRTSAATPYWMPIVPRGQSFMGIPVRQCPDLEEGQIEFGAPVIRGGDGP